MSRPGPSTNRIGRAFVEVQVAANVPVPDPQEAGTCERTESHSLEDAEPELERVLTERALVARGRSCGYQARHVSRVGS